MYTVEEILSRLLSRAPSETAEEWDNVGLMVGDRHGRVNSVLVCLDITPEVVEQAVMQNVRLIVTHHPLIFHAIKAVEADSLVYRLIANDIAVISLHTNLDKAPGGVNDTLAVLLKLEDVKVAADGMCRIGTLSRPLSGKAFANHTAQALNTTMRVCCPKREVRRVAVCGGSGGDLLLGLGDEVDAVVTGEIRHHEWLEWNARGITAVEAGHHATEMGVVKTLAAWLCADHPELQVTEYEGTEPYCYYN